MPSLRFVCDFDGIAYPFVTGVGSHPRAQGLQLDNCWEWETPIHVVGSEHWPEALAHALSYETMRAVGLYSDFPPAMESLRAQGVEPLLMTHRSEDYVGAVRRLLAEHGLAWLSVTRATPKEKVAFCLAEDVRVLVDDHPETIEAAVSAGISALSLRFPYNSEVIERLAVANAPDWSSLEGMLLETLALRHGQG